MKLILRIVRCLDYPSLWTSRIISWLVLGIMFTLSFEVITRYFFAKANFWAYDAAWYSGATFIVMGGCFVMLLNGNVRIDIISMRFSRKAFLWIETVFFFIFFMPLWGMMTYRGWALLVRAIARNEVSDVSYWWPPLWPVRLTIALGITFLLLAAISWIIKCIYELRTGKELKSGLEVE